MSKVEKDFVIAGTTFVLGATALIERLHFHAELTLVRELDNKYDANAVAVYYQKRKCGFVPAGLAKELAPLLDQQVVVRARRKADKRFGICELVYIEPTPQEATQ